MSRIGETYNCELCGKEYRAVNKRQKYCSTECSYIAAQESTRRSHAEQAKKRGDFIQSRKIESRNKRVAAKMAMLAAEAKEYAERGLSYGQANAPTVEVNFPKWVKRRYL